MSQQLRQNIEARRRVYLVRHGEVSYFDDAGTPHRPDLVPLNEEGREQARELAKQAEQATRGRYEITVEPDHSPIGGGSLPGFELETRVVALRGPGASQLADSIRHSTGMTTHYRGTILSRCVSAC